MSAQSVAEAMPAACETSPGRRAVDLAHLARYTMADPALEAEILELFAGQAPVTIDRLRRAADEKQWREAAHTLKGSARAIGAWRLAAAAEAGERSEGWRAPVPERVAEIERAFAEVATFIGQLRRSRAA